MSQDDHIYHNYRSQSHDIEKIIKDSGIGDIIQYNNNILAL